MLLLLSRPAALLSVPLISSLFLFCLLVLPLMYRGGVLKNYFASCHPTVFCFLVFEREEFLSLQLSSSLPFPSLLTGCSSSVYDGVLMMSGCLFSLLSVSFPPSYRPVLFSYVCLTLHNDALQSCFSPSPLSFFFVPLQTVVVSLYYWTVSTYTAVISVQGSECSQSVKPVHVVLFPVFLLLSPCQQ